MAVAGVRGRSQSSFASPTTLAHWLHSGPDLILGLAGGQQAPGDELIYDVSLHATDGIQPSLILKLSGKQSSSLWGPCPELGVTSLKGSSLETTLLPACPDLPNISF